MRARWSTLALLSVLALGACDGDSLTAPTADDETVATTTAESFFGFGNRFGASGGTVFTASNDPGGNELLVFDRDRRGRLTYSESIPTEGLGTGGGLGNQGGIALSGQWLVAVNAGSDDVSLFRTRGRVRLADRAASGGTRPISVAIRGPLVYVLNGGGMENVTGFWLHPRGRLVPIPGATYDLSEAQVGSAQVGFSPNGRHLVVTEKATNRIVTFPVQWNGRLGASTVSSSAGQTPFGFAFSNRGDLIVSEAFGGAPGASVLSSYGFERAGGVDDISALVATTQTAACWVAVTPNGRYAYSTNTGSGSVSLFHVAHTGVIELADATAAQTDGTAPIDMALSDGGRFLYVLESATPSMQGYRVGHDGSLEPVGERVSLPAGVNGLAAR